MRRILVFFILLILLFSGGGQGREEHVMETTLIPFAEGMYLPLRPVADFFELPLHWDAIEKKAYIGNQGIEGVLFAGTFHVPLVELALAVQGDLDWSSERGEGLLFFEDRTLELHLPRPPQEENPPTVYLTFDDGPTEATPFILEVLNAYNVKASFFLVGENILKRPEIAREIVERGHQVGNHSFTHPLLPELSTVAMKHELELTQRAFRVITGVEPFLFRPPYGGWSPELKDIYEDMGMELTWWHINPQDFTNPGSKAMVNQILSELEPGAIILFHCKMSTAVALPAIINAIWDRGYDFDSL